MFSTPLTSPAGVWGVFQRHLLCGGSGAGALFVLEILVLGGFEVGRVLTGGRV